MESKIDKIAIIGGTGKEGKGLAYRWVKAGYEVIIGSRKLEKAKQAVKDLYQIIPADKKPHIFGKVNKDAALEADIIVITVPYAFHEKVIMQLKPVVQGKIYPDQAAPWLPAAFQG